MEKRKRRTILAMEATRATIEEDVRATAHVRTGELKASVRGSSDYDRLTGIWRGTVEIGGTGEAGRSLFWEVDRGGEHHPFYKRALYDAWLKEAFSLGMRE